MPVKLQKTTVARKDPRQQSWLLIDARDQILGRLAAKIAMILMGKHRPQYTPHVDTGDYVIVTNCRKIRLTGKKPQTKQYDHYTYHMGGRKVVLRQKTDYPWDGRIRITVEPEQPSVFGLNLRIPGWSREATLSVNDEAIDLAPITRKGYARIEREWKAGDRVELILPLPVERIEAHPAVRANLGRVALQRGPVVYCLEQVDNPVPLDCIVLPRAADLETRFEKDLLGGVVVVTGKALLLDDSDWKDTLYRKEPAKRQPAPITAIPYYAWDHREPGQMRVWLSAD